MPNEFEKQVRQKMDELDFVPAEPVWTKIEEQIRSKKEKKRMIFWLPVVALLLGGGVLWLSLSNGDNQTLSSNEQPVAAPGTNEEKDNATTYAPGTVSPPVNVNEEKPQGNNSESVIKTDGVTENKVSNNVAVASISAITPKQKNVKADKKLAIKESSTSTIEQNKNANSEPVLENAKKENVIVDKVLEGRIISVNPVQDPANTNFDNTNAGSKTVDEVAKKDSAAIMKLDSNQTKSPQPAPKQKQDAKWRIAVAGMAGFSGLADGLNVITMDKSLADAFTGTVTSAPPLSPSQATVQTSISNGFSFSVGAAAMRKLSDKFQFSVGLEYNYFTNKMEVGPDSAGYIRTYSNLASLPSPGPNTYTNHYHFISLPVDLMFQPLKKVPLNVSAGLAVQQLVASDALVYNSQYRAYQADKNSFTQTQLFSRFGLNYAVDIKKHQLSFGPQLNYGLSKLSKNDRDERLFAFGLRAAFIF